MCTIESGNDLCKGLLEASSGVMVSVAESCGRDARVTSRVGAHKKIWRATRSWCWGQGSRTAPLTYTPAYLAEKILTSRSALEGERKQVTVLFADLKGSMELLRSVPRRKRGSFSIPCWSACWPPCSVRRHGEPDHGRWHYGPLWRASGA